MDELEARIVELGEQEELAACGPISAATRSWSCSGWAPDRSSARPWRSSWNSASTRGPLGEEEAAARLREWWETRNTMEAARP